MKDETIKCAFCGQHHPVKMFKTDDSSVISDTCSTCVIVIDKIRSLMHKKEHGEISEETFLRRREELCKAYRI